MMSVERLLGHLLPSLEGWPRLLLGDQMQVLLAAALEGHPSPPLSSARLRAADQLVRGMFAHPTDPHALDALSGLAPTEEANILDLAGAFVPTPQAAALADRLAARSIVPSHERLAALLAAQDARRCDDLLARAGAATNRATESWVELVAAARLAALDAGVAVPRGAEEGWAALEKTRPGSHLFAAWLSAKLRLRARQDPVAALDDVTDACDEIGASVVATGVTSVVARAAASDRDAVWRTLADDELLMSDRATILTAFVATGPVDAREEIALGALLNELGSPRTQDDRHPKEVWTSAVALLELAARIGRADLAVRTIDAAGPPVWTIFVATRGPALLRAISEQRWDPGFWDQLAEAAAAAGPGRASATTLPTPPWADLDGSTVAALWQIETLPYAELLWYRPWGTGTP